MQSTHIKRRLRCRRDGPQLQDQQRISQRPMILIHLFAPRHTPKNPDGEEILRQASQRLQNDQAISYQAQYAVWGGQACMVALVDFDSDEGHNKREQTERLDDVVEARSSFFLAWGAGRLENQTGLDLEEKGS